MEWLYFLLAGLFIWTLTSTVDKILLKHHISDVVFYSFTPAVIHFPTILLLTFLPFTPELAPIDIYLIFASIGAGVLEFFIALFLFLAISRGELSDVLPLASLSTIFVLLFGWLIFGESLATNEFIALTLLIVGSLFMATTIKKGVFPSLSKAVFPVMIYALLVAISVILFKAILNTVHVWDFLFYSRLGSFLTGAVLLGIPFFRKRIMAGLRHIAGKIIFIALACKAISVFGFLFFFSALSYGTTALVKAASSTQLVMIFVLTTIVSLRWPTLLDADTSGQGLLRKSIGISFIILGVVFLHGII